ncbi:MAG: monofunctional biosynthetic peptidoglycan transglycosylase [Saprospiraceae bacterium]|nr:monofunctional biosynthetic peptidoglycan transglycosylase [Saprospiraceae bacterium]
MGFLSTRFALYPTLLKIYRIVKRIFLSLFFAHLIYTLLLIFIPVVSTPTIFWQWLNGKDIKKQWVSLDQISIPMQHAVIASEDQEFENHFGIDVDAIEKAMEFNKNHKRKKGASTISQQVAKNVFLWQNRDWLRKGLELYSTFLIELFWSKDRILEVYLNVAEMGDGIFGAEAAALHFYKKPASKLTANEAARIAACLPNPIRYRVNDPSDYVLKRQRWILWQMENIEWEK